MTDWPTLIAVSAVTGGVGYLLAGWPGVVGVFLGVALGWTGYRLAGWSGIVAAILATAALALLASG
jgi:hypothetical protein